MPQPVDLLVLLPEVAAIGKQRLQAYCDEWLRRPIAQQFGIAHLIVGSDSMVTVVIDDERARFVGEEVFIPIDELAGYIIDQHFSVAEKRREQHAKLRDLRDRWGDIGNYYEVLAGRVGRLWLTCKNPTCQSLLETGQQAAEGQTINMPPIEVTCPFCGVTDFYDGRDLWLKLGD